MKNNTKYSIFLYFITCLATSAQSPDQNYVQKTSYLNFEHHHNNIESKQYYDGLGRLTQISQGGNNANENYINTHQEYDALGNIAKKWCPVTCSRKLDYLPTDLLQPECKSLYDDSPFSYITYDGLNRVLFTSTPGDAWKGRGIYKTYRNNNVSEVKKYSIFNMSGNIFYEPNTLSCVVEEDGDSHKVLIFQDFLGRTILIRKYDGSKALDTYYVYNNLNQLVYVLQPKYQDIPDLNKLAFQYTYDDRGRLKTKTLPGCSSIEYWYNNANQVIKMQDGVLRKAGKIRVFEYDDLGRITKQSISNGAKVEYDEIRNYYDNYEFADLYEYLPTDIAERIFLLDDLTSPSHLTGVWQRASNGEEIISTFGYDWWGRLEYKYELGLDRHLSRVWYIYNYAGDIEKEIFEEYTFNKLDNNLHLIYNGEVQNNYDAPHTKLLTSSVITIDDYVSKKSFKDTIQALTYDDFGNIVKIDRGGKKADMSYQYDLLHGWVKQIKSIGGFEQNLYRETDGKHPRWDGSISAMSWKTDNEYIRRYDYTYDELNRLTSAEFGSKFNSLSINNKVVVPKDSLVRTPIIDKPIIGNGLNSASAVKSLIPETGSSLIAINALDAGTVQYNAPVSQSVSSIIGSRYGGDLRLYVASNENYSEFVSYDSNSNIISLQRYGDLTSKKDYGLIDDLTITHNGNQLRSVEDQAGGLKYNDALDFDDGKDFDDEYSYNGNGALTMDLNKGIQKIEYDLLGNPKKITLSNNYFIEYVYTVDGRRLRTKHYRLFPNPSYSSLLLRGDPYLLIGDSTDYIGNLILKNGTPSMYQFNGGYYSFNEAGALDGCHYYVEDYQGNNRMVVNANTDEIEQVTHYYPFGGVMADISTGQDLQKYKYGGKEFDRTYGLDLYDFHARQYDAIMPSFTSIDPMAEKYYSISPYAYCAGNPVNCIDPDGKKIVVNACPQDFIESICASISSLLGLNYKTNYQIKTEFAIENAKSLDSEIKSMVGDLESSSLVFSISSTNDSSPYNKFNPDNKDDNTPTGGTIIWDANSEKTKQGDERPAVVGLIHEMGHASDYSKGNQDKDNVLTYTKDGLQGATGMSEKTAFKYENLARKALNLPERVLYGGKPLSEFTKMNRKEYIEKYGK